MIIMSMTHHALTRHGARALDILDAYWTGLAVQGDLPLWSDVDPGQFQDALDHAFLAKRFGRSHARIRVAGGAVEDLSGQRCSGLPLSLLIRNADRAAFNDALTTCCDTRRAVEVALTSRTDAANQTVAARLMLYPLKDIGGRVTQFLGGLALTGEAIEQPGQFGVATITFRPAQTRRPYLRLVVDNQ